MIAGPKDPEFVLEQSYLQPPHPFAMQLRRQQQEQLVHRPFHIPKSKDSMPLPCKLVMAFSKQMGRIQCQTYSLWLPPNYIAETISFSKLCQPFPSLIFRLCGQALTFFRQILEAFQGWMLK